MSNILKEDLKKLNERQLAIIKKFDKASLIVAGPGTGKTRTISVLIGSLLEKGVRLREILALTFSSKAADELKERVLEYYPHSFDRCWISTFHSFCARILREQYHLVGIKPDFRLLTGFKEALIMDEICKRQDSRAFKEFGKVLKKRGFQQEVLTFISLLKSNLVSPDEFEKTVSACKSLPERTINRCSELLNIFKLYENERIKTGYLDFRDLIGLTIKVLKNKVVANSYQKMFKVILVDEFQDTDPAQYLLLTLLRGENTEIKTAVIGDPHQSIYRFRGADPSMMSATSPFKQKYKARVFPLEINYRSSEAITNAANRMQWSEKSACESKLTNLSGRAGFAKYYKVRDELDEARLIGRKIASMVIYKDEKQYKPSDIAILVRNNYQIDLITESLKSLHIPFDIAGDMKFFKSEEVILLSSLFKYVGTHKPEDEQIKTEALKRAFVSPVFGINPLWVQSVLAVNDSNSHVHEVIENIKNSDFSKLPETDEGTQVRAVAFAKALSLIEENKDKDVETILAALLLIISERAPEPDSLEGRNILHFRGMFADYCELFEATNKRKPLLDDIMPDFDEWLAYYASTLEQTSDTGSTGVKIMTVHQSKGLEFPVVFLCGLSEDLFPVRLRENILISTNALEELKNEFNRSQREVSFFNPYPCSFEEHLEEERRLFFVALTRAKDGIIMSSPLKIGSDRVVPSPFITETGIEENLHEADERPLTISEFRTEIAKLSAEELALIEEALTEAEKRITPEMSVHGVRPRAFGKNVSDAVTLPQDFCFSANSIKTYIECPRKFFFQNLLKIQKPGAISQKNYDKGNAFHKCVEVLHNPESIWEKGKDPTDEELEEIFKEHAMPFFENENYFYRQMITEKLQEALYNYRNAVFRLKQISGRNTIGVEMPFNFKFNDCNITGRFDRIVKLADDAVLIADYKTSGQTSSDKMHEKAFSKEGWTEVQMPLYLLACKKKGYKHASMNLLYVNDEVFGEKNRSKMIPGFLRTASFNMGCGPEYGKEVTEGDMAVFEENLRQLLDKIKTDNVFSPDPNADKNARTCKNRNKNMRCEFEAFCEAVSNGNQDDEN